MRRLIWSQLRHRAFRALALGLGMLVATTAFTVLTSASRTSQLTTTGLVNAHFNTAYHLLLRPKGSETALERSTGTVQPNFLSGIYGGITLAQYHQVQRIPGVDVAAPIAMVGYSLTSVPITIPVPAGGSGRALFRYTTTWKSSGSAVTQPISYVYVTPSPLKATDLATTENGQHVCSALDGKATGPFSPQVQGGLWCWSRANGYLGGGDFEGLTAKSPGLAVFWSFPMLVAAIDPVAEAKLDGLDTSLLSGHYLAPSPGSSLETQGQFQTTTFPVLASSSSGVSESATTTIQQLPAPTGIEKLDVADSAAKATVPGTQVISTTMTAAQAYQKLLDQLTGKTGKDFSQGIDGYWSVSPTTYTKAPDGVLTPRPVSNPGSVWKSLFQSAGYVTVPPDNADLQYRAISEHESNNLDFSGSVEPFPAPRAVGVFDPAKIASFDALSAVPLSAYEPTKATAADGSSLLPSLNLGGYVSQPPQLLTNLAALPTLEDSTTFSGDLHAKAPISVIRVRVAGVKGPDSVSRERVKEVAQQIAVKTGLDVDIVIGSSPQPTTIALTAGRFGRPALKVQEGWVHKGVAIAILSAADRKSLLLFVLILVVCGLFVGNAGTAAVRRRRQELAVLACLGWSRARLFGVVLGELAAIGLVAGVVGSLVSVPAASAAGLHTSWARSGLAIPASVLLSLAAGAVPAWLAGRAQPAVAVRPAAVAVRRAAPARGLTGLALSNVLRTPGRTAIGVLSLAVGVAAFTMVAGVTLAFRGTVVGSLLGNAVAVRIRGVDYVAVIATVALGILSVADVLYLNIRERSAELATLRALGWEDGTLRRLVLTEAGFLGFVGALLGAGLGLGGSAALTGHLAGRVVALSLGALVAATVLTLLASLLPLQQLRRIPTAQLLAEE